MCQAASPLDRIIWSMTTLTTAPSGDIDVEGQEGATGRRVIAARRQRDVDHAVALRTAAGWTWDEPEPTRRHRRRVEPVGRSLSPFDLLVEPGDAPVLTDVAVSRMLISAHAPSVKDQGPAENPILIGITGNGVPVMRARPVFVDGHPDLRVCSAPGCDHRLEGQRRHASYCSAECRRVAQQRRRRAAKYRKRLEEVAAEYIKQTTDHAVFTPAVPAYDLGALQSTLADVPSSVLTLVIGVMKQSPEHARGDDAWHYRLLYPLRALPDGENAVNVLEDTAYDNREDDIGDEPPDDITIDLTAGALLASLDLDLLHCIRNTASGVSWPESHGSLGYVRNRHVKHHHAAVVHRMTNRVREPEGTWDPGADAGGFAWRLKPAPSELHDRPRCAGPCECCVRSISAERARGKDY
jgi:hypothetical protein